MIGYETKGLWMQLTVGMVLLYYSGLRLWQMCVDQIFYCVGIQAFREKKVLWNDVAYIIHF